MVEEAPPNIIYAPSLHYKKSIFVGLAAAAKNQDDLDNIIKVLPSSSTVIAPYAWRLEGGADGFDDDGDLGTGFKLLQVLREWDIENVLLAVSRDDSSAFISGNYLGVKRYKIAVDCARSVLRICYRLLRSPVQDNLSSETEESTSSMHKVKQDTLQASEALYPSKIVSDSFLDSLPNYQHTESNHKSQRKYFLRSELRVLRYPHREVEAVCRAACALIFQSASWHDTEATDWIDVRSALTAPTIHNTMHKVSTQVDPDLAASLAQNLLSADLGPKAAERVRMRSIVAGSLLDFIWSILKPYITLQERYPAEENIYPAGQKLVVPKRPEDITRIGNRVQAGLLRQQCPGHNIIKPPLFDGREEQDVVVTPRKMY